MPRKPKNSSPLRELRSALQKTQQQLGRALGVSRRYIQAFELGQRPIPARVCDEIELQFGVKANSLKQRQGFPVVWCLEERTIALMPQRISGPILKELRKLRGKPRERLRYQINRWKEMLPRMEEKAPRDDTLHKLQILLDAAAAKHKQMSALFQLDRWIEDQIVSLNLREAVVSIAQKRGKRGALGTKPMVLPIGSLATNAPNKQPATRQRSGARRARS
jgi:transcriptional regulator with XRE-family HTH domain